MKISVSYLSSVFDKKSTINMIDNTSCDYLHVDLMDGRFVPKNNFNVKEVLNDLQDIKKPLDIHLMVEDPEKYIEDLSTLKPATIIFHIESSADIHNTIELIKNKGIRVGIAIKPNTDISVLSEYIELLDVILVMTVEPGAGGQGLREPVPSREHRAEVRHRARRVHQPVLHRHRQRDRAGQAPVRRARRALRPVQPLALWRRGREGAGRGRR